MSVMNTLNITLKEDYVIVQLNRGKVNAVNLEMVRDLNKAFQSFKKDDSVRGVILTGQPHFFTAGLDVIELYSYDKETIRAMFIEFGELYIELAKFQKPLIAAITGHAPAAGTVLAIPCDYRVMVEGDKYTLGLHEILVNIGLSEDVISGYAFWLGRGLAARYLLKGKLMNATDAHTVGFVDEVCSMEKVLEQAEKQMQQYLKAEPQILQSIKFKARKSWLNQLGLNGEKELKESLEIWWKPEVRARMKGFVERLTKK
jgi:3,2-trans-enoyl-CoA isomerase